MNKSSQIVVGAAVAIVAAVAGMLLSRSLVSTGPMEGPALVAGTWLEPGRPLPDFTLVDQQGQPFDRDSLRNQYSLLFFGFTSCPDICPATLATLSEVEKSFADLPEQNQPRIVFVSVDPGRDTPDRVAAYVSYFSPQFTGITGSDEAIKTLAGALHVPYAITPLNDGNYTVDHSSALFLIGPDADLKAIFSAPHTAANLVTDLRGIAARPVSSSGR